MIRTYSELIKQSGFDDRYAYLKLSGAVGLETFGPDRYLNQIFYSTKEWQSVRDYVITRDNGCDLGVPGFDIHGLIIVHHMNPISVNDIISHSEDILDPEFLICTSKQTHDAIHYGNPNVPYSKDLKERTPNDTCPWR